MRENSSKLELVENSSYTRVSSSIFLNVRFSRTFSDYTCCEQILKFLITSTDKEKVRLCTNSEHIDSVLKKT